MNNMIAVRTPFWQLLIGMVLGQLGNTMAAVIPLALLLTLKLVELDPQNVAANMGMAAGLASLVGIFSSYIGGAVSDRTNLSFGRRRTWILAGSVLAGVCLVALGATKDIGQIILYWCLAVFCINFAMASLSALIPDQVEEGRRGMASGIIGLFNPVAIVTGMGLMTALNSIPTATKFDVIAGVVVVCGVVCCFIIKDGPGLRQLEVNQVQEKLTFGEKLGKVYPSPRKYPAFSWGVLTRFLVSMAFNTQMFGTLYLMQKFNIPAEAVTGVAALTMLIQTICLALASFFGGMLSDKYRKQKPFVEGAAVLVAIGVFILAFAPSMPVVFIGNAIIGAGFGAYLAVDMALTARILPNKKDAAKDFGIMNIAGTLPQSLVMAIASPLLAMGGFPVFYGVLAITGILSAAAVIPIPEMSSKPVQE
ncbi:MAG: major facilitator superfamily 1 [Firmicutes bacterium]|nr:major facilitator superfamily 1 [Bacillota bacterium]